MTSRYYIERCAKRVVENTCCKCMHARLWNGWQVVCENKESDHYCHIVTAKHPACKLFMMVVDAA